MVLHPSARAFLDAQPPTVGAGDPGYDVVADRGAASPPARVPGDAVETIRDVDAGGVPARLYVPERAAHAVVAVHGGGWCKGSVESYDAIWRLLAARSGLALLSVGYRLAPEHPYPAALEDVSAATGWLRAAAPGLGLAPDRLGIVGDSSGGNLAAGSVLREPGAYAAQALIYPALDITCGSPAYDTEREGLSRRKMQWYWAAYAGSTAAEGVTPQADLSPLHAADLAGLPPAYVVTAEHDCLRDDGERYAVWLAAAGVPVVATRFLGMIHGFWNAPAVFAESQAAADAVGAWLRGQLQP